MGATWTRKVNAATRRLRIRSHSRREDANPGDRAALDKFNHLLNLWMVALHKSFTQEATMLVGLCPSLPGLAQVHGNSP